MLPLTACRSKTVCCVYTTLFCPNIHRHWVACSVPYRSVPFRFDYVPFRVFRVSVMQSSFPVPSIQRHSTMSLFDSMLSDEETAACIRTCGIDSFVLKEEIKIEDLRGEMLKLCGGLNRRETGFIPGLIVFASSSSFCSQITNIFGCCFYTIHFTTLDRLLF